MDARDELIPANSRYALPSEETILEVTPEMASDWLSYRDHPNNRPISPSVSARYQADMEAVPSRWRQGTPEGWIFDTNGFWISGRHRAKAQANAGVTLRWRIFPNEPRDIAPFLDQGHRRTAAHLLRVPYATQAGGAARHLAALADGDRWGMPRYNKISIPEVVETYGQWPELGWFATDAWALQAAAKVKGGPHLAVLAQAARAGRHELIPVWLEGVRTGANLDADDPRLRLRNRFASGLTISGKTNPRDHVYALIVKAWNAFVNGERVTQLTWKTAEPLPTVEGFSFKTKGQAA